MRFWVTYKQDGKGQSCYVHLSSCSVDMYLVDSKSFKLVHLVILQSCLAKLKDLVNFTADEFGVMFGNN